MKKLLIFFLLILSLTSSFCATSQVIGVRQTSNGSYEGVIADLQVTINDGTGHVYIDTTPLTEIDTQASARLAKEVACEVLSIDCNNKDFFYVIKGEFPMIGGPSAGAAMAVLTMVELSNVNINNEVAMTGTINPDGSIGSIGGVVEKAIAARDAGVKTFLIPQGQLNEFTEEIDDLTIIEVATIREAYSYFTNIIFTEQSDEIRFDNYNLFMKPMSEELMNYSLELYDELINQYNYSNLTIDDTFIIESLIQTTTSQINDMDELYNNNSYYSAASYSVGAGINSLYTTYLINYFKNNDTEYVSSLINFAKENVEVFESEINKQFTLDDINDLEALNIATDRYFEAKQLVEEAQTYYNQADIPSTLYNIAFSYIRLETSKLWLSVLDSFQDSIRIEFSQELLAELALNRIEAANTMITYAESIDYSYYTLNANDHLTQSRTAYEQGNYIFSIFESLRSLSNANLAMQLRGITSEQVSDRIELSKTQARQNINLVQSNGLTPIMALSYYEYSEAFEEDNPGQALIFLEYSKQFSLLSFQMVNHIDGSIIENFFEQQEPEEIGMQLSILILSMIIGFTLVIVIMSKVIR